MDQRRTVRQPSHATSMSPRGTSAFLAQVGRGAYFTDVKHLEWVSGLRAAATGRPPAVA